MSNPILYYTNAGGDRNWETLTNWNTAEDGSGDNPTNIPWTDDGNGGAWYSGYDLVDATGGNGINFSSAIDPNGVVTGTCNISGINNSYGGYIYGGTFSGNNFSNNYYGYINGGTFTGSGFNNNYYGTIYGGAFTGDSFYNNYYGYINGGTFTGSGFNNNYYGTIYGGAFTGDSFYNNYTIFDGTFSGDNFNNNGAIVDGTFTGNNFNNNADIYGGTFSGANFTNYGLIDDGTFSGDNFNNNGDIGGGTFTGDNFNNNNYGYIYGGAFPCGNVCDCGFQSYDCLHNCNGNAYAGCTDSSASNYDYGATCDNGSCWYTDCNDQNACNYDSNSFGTSECSFPSDNCNNCDGSCGGVNGCSPDCNGDCGGTHVTDACGNCVSNAAQLPTIGQVLAGVQFGCGNSLTGTFNPASVPDWDNYANYSQGDVVLAGGSLWYLSSTGGWTVGGAPSAGYGWQRLSTETQSSGNNTGIDISRLIGLPPFINL